MNPQPKVKNYRAKQYRKYIDSFPCLACGRKSTHHHWRKGTDGGTALKPSDYFCIPVCPKCHNELHTSLRVDEDPWEVRNDIDICSEIFYLIETWNLGSKKEDHIKINKEEIRNKING